MPDIGDLRRLAQGVPDQTTRRVLTEIAELLVGRGGVEVGVPEHQTRSKNWASYYLTGTTSTTADQEFSIAHGLGRAPYVILPVLDAQTVNARAVRLKTTRAADSQRIYLSSPETGAAITLLVEG